MVKITTILLKTIILYSLRLFLLAKTPSRLLKAQQNGPCLLLCLLELLFTNLKCACANRYFVFENLFQKCAYSDHIGTSYLLANQR
jgi:hypothetical protein